jgi:MSHA biogenesis protein MshQ
MSGMLARVMMFVLMLMGAAVTHAATLTASPSSCTAVKGLGTVDWSNASRATTRDSNYATASSVKGNVVTHYIQCTGYNFAVPAGSIINGITVTVERMTDGGNITDAYVYLVKGGVISTAFNGATTTNYPTSRGAEAHGGSTALWGTSWAAADINNANFGVVFSSKNTSTTSTTSRTVSVDQISITVTYTASGGSGGAASYSVVGNPTSCVSVTGAGTNPWNSPGNAQSSNNSYATVGNMTAGKESYYLKCSGYGLTVPDGATVTGIRVSVERRTDGGTITDSKLYLVRAGTISTAYNGATTTSYPKSDGVEVHGGTGNLWGASWTPAELNSASFGVALTVRNTSTSSTTNRTVSLDMISVEVEFSYAGSLPSGDYSMVSSPSACLGASGVGTLAWSAPGNAQLSDNTYATAVATSATGTQLTQYLKCTGFNFAVPAGSVINGIKVELERKISSTSSTTGKDNVLSLINAQGAVGASNRATTTVYTKTDESEEHGSASDLWGASWTPADINSGNFGVAYSGNITKTSTSSTRTISIDQIRVRVYMRVTAPVTANHVAVSASNVGNTCSPSHVTITPHDAAHSRTPNWGGTIQVTTSDARGDWAVVSGSAANLNNGTANDGLATYAFGAGESSVTLGLTHTTAGPVTVGVADATTGSSLTASTPAAELVNVISYSAGGFSITDAAGNPVTDMTQTAGQTSPVYYLYAVNNSCSATFTSAKTLDMAFECVDPVSCQSPVVTVTNTTTGQSYRLPTGMPAGTSTPTAYTAVSLNFTANSRAPFTINYPDTGKITLYFRYAASSMLSESPPFVVKPAGFVLSGVQRSGDNVANPGAATASGTKFVKAGEAFSATVTAVTASGAAAPNFGREVTPESVELTPSLVAGLGLSHNPPLTGSFGAFSGGVASGSRFAWDEVGVIQLTPHIAPDASGVSSYLGAGDVQGTTSGPVGRFYLGKFDLQLAALEPRAELCPGDPNCPSPFAYMGEQVDANFTLVAMSVNGRPVQNYVGAFAKLDPRLFAGLNLGAVDATTTPPPAFAQPPYLLTARLSNAGMPVATCNTEPCFQLDGGGIQAQATVKVPFTLTRGAAGDGAYAAVGVGIAPVDADGAPVDGAVSTACNNPLLADCYTLDTDATPGNDRALVGTTEFRHGRLKLASGYGSERLPLPLTATLQYWDWERSYVTSIDDLLTPVDLVLSNWNGNLATGETVAAPQPLVFTNGVAAYTLSAPGAGNDGGVDISARDANTAAAFGYLSVLSGRAMFGVYKGSNEFIDIRELF